jgi:MFS family permease
MNPQRPISTPDERSGGPASGSAEEDVERDLPRNFSAMLVHGLLGQTGFRLLNAPTFLPHFASELAGAASGGTVMRAVQSLGQFLSPLFAVSVVEHRPHAKQLGVVFGSAMRIQILLLAGVALFVPDRAVALWLVWLLMGLFGLALGLQGVAFQVVMAKVIPIERRGRLLGLRDVASGAMLIAVAAVGGALIERYGFAAGNGYTFLLAFGLTSLGLGAFAAVREPAGRELRGRTPLAQRLRELPVLLRAEPDFRRFLSARLFASAARGVLPLYIVWLGREFGMSGARLGAWTVIFALAQSGSTLGWGWLGDRAGYKPVFQLSSLCGLAGTGLLLVVSTPALAALTYALVGASLGGFVLAGSNLVLEFGTERERAMRIATHNASTELVGMLGYLGAGLLADGVSFRAAFVASMALHLLAILRAHGMRDPRRERRERALGG